MIVKESHGRESVVPNAVDDWKIIIIAPRNWHVYRLRSSDRTPTSDKFHISSRQPPKLDAVHRFISAA